VKLTIEPTKDWIRTEEGALCRVWRVVDGSALVFVAAVAVPDDQDVTEFERELIEIMAAGESAPKPGTVLS
jgi:hypothetical protein